MENVNYNQLTLARREDDHADLVANEDQPATSNLQHAWFIYYYVAMMLFLNIPPPLYMVRSDFDPTTLSTRVTQQHDTAPGFSLQGNQRDGGNWGAWSAGVTGYLGICALLLSFIQIKTEKETESPFQTHFGFIIIMLTAVFVTLFTSGIMIYTNNNLQSLMNEHYYYSPVLEIILKSLLCFNAILGLLSPLLILFIPPVYNWIGYVIVCALFVAVIAFNFTSLKRSLATTHENDSGDVEMA